MYSAGGGGIHRNLNQAAKPKQRPGEAYKAKVIKKEFFFSSD